MAHGGFILIILFQREIFPQEKLPELPYLFTYGFINMEKSRNLLNSWKYQIQEYCTKQLSAKELDWEKAVKKLCRRPIIKGLKNGQTLCSLRGWTG